MKFQSTKTHVDHQAEAYVAPRRVMSESNGNIANGNGSIANGNGSIANGNGTTELNGSATKVCFSPVADITINMQEYF